MFKKYQHIERLGSSEVQDLLYGECYLFYKIDGTNGSVWLEGDTLKAGSRNRELSLENDNAGFYKFILESENIKNFFTEYPKLRLYGEFLVPHSLRNYKESAWRDFYVFDVTVDTEDDKIEYLPYNQYKEILEKYNINYIPPICIMKNPTIENIYLQLEKTGQYLIEDGKGMGEGLVLKNYFYKNKYGRQTWAKVITTEFKEINTKTMGCPIIENKELVEVKIVDKFCTKAFIEKEFYKLKNEKEMWSSKFIPELLGKIWYEFINEESFNFIKEYRFPTINYKTLQSFVTKKIKETLVELF